MRTKQYAGVVLALLLAACGSTTTQRAATGGIAGAVVGGVVGGPVGLVVGGVVGSAGGALAPEGADKMAEDIIHGNGFAASKPPAATAGSSVPPNPPKEQPSASAARPTRPPANTSTAVQIAPDLVRQIQTSLKSQGLYQGPIDGRVGPGTRSGLAALEARGGGTGINLETMQMLVSQGPSDESGSSAVAPNPPASPPGQPPAAVPTSPQQQPPAPGGGEPNNPTGR